MKYYKTTNQIWSIVIQTLTTKGHGYECHLETHMQDCFDGCACYNLLLHVCSRMCMSDLLFQYDYINTSYIMLVVGLNTRMSKF